MKEFWREARRRASLPNFPSGGASPPGRFHLSSLRRYKHNAFARPRGRQYTHTMKKTNCGFSLIEMLVVIAVISILAALLWPLFSQAREKGRDAQCVSNLRQLHIGMMNFAADSGDRLPLPMSCDTQDVQQVANDWKLCWVLRRGWVNWRNYENGRKNDPTARGEKYSAWWGSEGIDCITNGTLFPYVDRVVDVYLCPTFALSEVCGRSDAVRSYSMNRALCPECNGGGCGGEGGVLLYAVTNASATILLGDEQLVYSYTDPRADSEFDPGTQVGKFHSAKTAGNVVYVDGHVDKYPSP